jgi:hypothetical protein
MWWAQEWATNYNHFISQLASCFKGKVSQDGYLFKGLNILISTYFVCADGFQGLPKAFHYPIQLLTFYLLL